MAAKKAQNMYIAVVLDKSGSMSSVQHATISGFNEFLNDQKKDAASGNGKTTFALTLFDTIVDATEPIAIAEAVGLGPHNYQPGGRTALYDAVGATIHHAEKMTKKNDKVLFVVQTDGQENSSHEFTPQAIFDLVEQKKKDGWGFLFLGADMDSYLAEQIGHTMAFPSGSTATYQKANTMRTFSVTSNIVKKVRAGTIRNDSLGQDLKPDDND